MLAVTVRELRALGHDAQGLVYARNWAQSNDMEGCEVYPEIDRSQKLKRRWRRLQVAMRAAKLVREVDVVHWYNALTAEGPVDLWLASRMKKKGVVEFVGGDIRNCEIAGADNPYYRAAWESGKYEYGEETPEHSRKVQQTFLKYGVRSAFAHETLKPFLLPGEWVQQLPCRWRLDVKQFTPRYSEPTSEPLIVHMTTAPVCKGTERIESILETLSQTHHFRYQRIQKMSRAEAFQLLSDADIYLDQFVIAEGMGVAALEAMAMGKPVVSYIKPALQHCWEPSVVGYVNAPFEELGNAVGQLIEDADIRRNLGMQSRGYVEENHDGPVVARLIAEGYEQLRSMG